MAVRPLRDGAVTFSGVENGRLSAVRVVAFLSLMLIAGCAPVLVVPSLNPADFSLLILAYSGLALVASGIVWAFYGRLVGSSAQAGAHDDQRRRWMLAAIILTGLTLAQFQVFKQLVLPHRGFPFDAQIADFEHRLLGGRDAWQVSHALFGGLGPTLVLDAAYAIWLPIMFLFPAVVVAAMPKPDIRARLLGTWVASWILIGSLAAWLLGSAGPCYYNALVGPHDGFLALHQALEGLNTQASAYGLSIHALYFQQMLFQTQGGGLVFASGISAMPSMHVAMGTLFAIAGFQRSRILGAAFALYATLIWIASIHLGWHYASDGVLGSAMMVALWLLSAPVVKAVKAARMSGPRRTAVAG